MKYGNWLKLWLEEYVRPFAKRRTYIRYSEIVVNRLAPAFGEIEISEIDTLMLQKFINELMRCGNRKCGCALASNSVNGIISVLNGSLGCARRLGIVQNCASAGIVRPKSREKHIDCFSVDEQKKIEGFVTEYGRDADFGIIICLYTGIRLGELLALEWSDVDLKKKCININKSCHFESGCGATVRIVESTKTSASERTIPLSCRIAATIGLLKRRSVSKYVISSGEDAMGARTYQKRFSSILSKLGIEHRGFHALRHTFATRAVECGMDVKCLSEILGHRSGTVTLNRYVHSTYERKRAMMNRIGKLL